jgi:type II secretory pathway predicted ATPase ExeA
VCKNVQIAMLLEFFHLWDEPFGVTPDPAYLYPSPSHLQALDSLRNGILGGRGFMTLIAEPGMGKTTLLYQLIEQMPQTTRTAYLFQTQCNSLEFMQYLLHEVGVDPAGMGLVAMHRRLNEILFNEMVQGKQFVLIVDESQNLSKAVLETIRLLSNFETAHSKLLQIVLAGQTELATKLKQPELSQLLQRVTVMASIEALSFEETAAYIRHRLKLAGHNGDDLFDPAAFAAVYRRTKGIPRNINRVCHAALEQAAADKALVVTAAIVEKSNRGLGATAEDLQRSRFANQPRQEPPASPPPPARASLRAQPSQSDQPQADAPSVSPAHPVSRAPQPPVEPDPPAPVEHSVSAPSPDSSEPGPPPPPSPQPSIIPPPLPPQLSSPYPDFVPPPPQHRSYRWLAWVVVLATLLILAFLVAPANVRDSLLQKIQPTAGSAASLNESRPAPNVARKSLPPTDVQQHATSVGDPPTASTAIDATIKSLKIVIDPGHGGADSGARGPNGLLEKNVCLEVALRLGQLLEDELPGTEVTYTRSDDQNITTQRRAAAASESAADLFISIHADLLGDAQGPRVYYSGGSEKKSAGRRSDGDVGKLSLQFAGDVQESLLQQLALKGDASPMRAPAQPAFAVLSDLQVPAAVVEIPFTDKSSLLDPTQRQKLAEALSRGIATFAKEHASHVGAKPAK